MLMITGLFGVTNQVSAEIQSTIRVYLRRLRVTDTLNLTIHGEYMTSDGKTVFSDGTNMTIVLRGSQLVLHSGGIVTAMGDKMQLIHCQSEHERQGITIAGNEGLYEGDLSLDIDNGVIRPILSIHVEDYLLGVVPFEMGDSFPLEALKAQAITARTYALRKSGSSGAYDVEDTTNDQAYRGRTTYSPLSEQAVKETKGICGVYRGALAQCFYSASNGGQTELGQHVWPTSDPDAYGYMDMRDDPYDFENKKSAVKRYSISKKPNTNGIGTALHHALVFAMAEQLASMGVEADPALIRFDEIQNVEAITPKYDGDSRLMTELRFTVKISTRTCTFRQTPTSQPLQTPSPEDTPETPMPTATPAYSAYTKVKEPLIVILPIFTEAEQAMGLSINVSKNELVTVYDIGSEFMIESRRFGHGVGMSQRGAEQMASQYGMTYEQILSFYYPGMGLVSYDMIRSPLPTIDMEMMATPAPTPSPTLRPTLMPVTESDLPKDAYIAQVTNIDEDSTLNLRQEPNLSSDVIRRLYKNQKLIVLGIDQDGWAHVKTDVIEGYVRSEYIQADKET
jgi:spoIID/lytB domain protein